MAIRFLTAGESHGPLLTVVVDGLPAGLQVDRSRIDAELARRQGGYGRGGRMRIEHDRVRVAGGVRLGETIGGPVSLLIENLDAANWADAMGSEAPPPGLPEESLRRVTAPRPGHADLAGALKFGRHDARDVLERASARETAARVAAGALAKGLLAALDCDVLSHTIQVGEASLPSGRRARWEEIAAIPDESPLRCVDPVAEMAMVAEIDAARAAKDSVGGAFEVVARGVPPGLGSYSQWDLRLDGRLAAAIVSIPAVKAAEVGEGVASAGRRGSDVHDAIRYDAEAGAFRRPTNRAGGIEGGVSNGEEIRVTGYMKPLSTLPRPLGSADLVSKAEAAAAVERTDTCAIAAAGVVGEAMAALVLASAFLEKLGGDSLDETRRNLDGYLAQLRAF